MHTCRFCSQHFCHLVSLMKFYVVLTCFRKFNSIKPGKCSRGFMSVINIQNIQTRDMDCLWQTFFLHRRLGEFESLLFLMSNKTRGLFSECRAEPGNGTLLLILKSLVLMHLKAWFCIPIPKSMDRRWRSAAIYSGNPGGLHVTNGWEPLINCLTGLLLPLLISCVGWWQIRLSLMSRLKKEHKFVLKSVLICRLCSWWSQVIWMAFFAGYYEDSKHLMLFFFKLYLVFLIRWKSHVPINKPNYFRTSLWNSFISSHFANPLCHWAIYILTPEPVTVRKKIPL